MSEGLQRASSFATLLQATARAAEGKRQQPEVARFLMDAERECLRLQRTLRLVPEHPAAWQPGPCKQFVIRDPKVRKISVVPFRDRVVHHALCSELLPQLERYAIHDSYACREGKGQHAALGRARQFVQANRDGWALKADIASYFASIPHERLMKQVRKRVPDAELCDLLERIVRAYPVTEGRGLPIGTLTSQHLANLYLGALDHQLKDNLGVRYYLRYMDDFVAMGSQAEMTALRQQCEDFLKEALDLKLNPRSTQLVRVRDGVPMLGVRVYPGLIRVRPERWRGFAKKQQSIEVALCTGELSEEEAAVRLSSQYSHLMRFNTHRKRCNHLARLSEVSSQWGEGQRRLPASEPWRVLEQRREERARREPQQERAWQPQQEPWVSSCELSTFAEPSGLIRGERVRPEAPSLRTAEPAPRC
jgi:RNA-directed DNA polymerase